MVKSRYFAADKSIKAQEKFIHNVPRTLMRSVGHNR